MKKPQDLMMRDEPMDFIYGIFVGGMFVALLVLYATRRSRGRR